MIFLVVQDIFMTETAQLADVVLPGASFAEKDGTFTSSERRVQRVRKAINSPGAAKSDLDIIDQIYKRIAGEGDLDCKLLIPLRYLTRCRSSGRGLPV